MEGLPELFGGEAHGVGDGLDTDFAAPSPRDLFPWHAGGHLIQDLPYHDAASFKGGLSTADAWIHHDVRAQSAERGSARLEATVGWAVFHQSAIGFVSFATPAQLRQHALVFQAFIASAHRR
jgi:hypothetical protein